MKENLKNQLMAELSRRNIDMVVHWILERPDRIESLVDLVLDHDDVVSTRASWALEKVSMKMNEPVRDYIDKIIGELPKIRQSSTRRTLSKVLALHSIPEKYDGEIFDFCMQMIESPSEPVAVKANCMTIIFNLLTKYPDLKKEVFTVIENQISNNSVGFKSRFSVLKRKYHM